AQAIRRLQGVFPEARAISDNINRLLSNESQEKAFGIPGLAGDPIRIEHLARRLIDVYGGLLDWSARLRGATVPERFADVFRIAGSFVNDAIGEFRAFVQHLVKQVDTLPGRLRAGEQIHLEITLTLTNHP